MDIPIKQQDNILEGFRYVCWEEEDVIELEDYIYDEDLDRFSMKGSSLQFDNLSEAESAALSPDKDENVYSFLN